MAWYGVRFSLIRAYLPCRRTTSGRVRSRATAAGEVTSAWAWLSSVAWLP